MNKACKGTQLRLWIQVAWLKKNGRDWNAKFNQISLSLLNSILYIFHIFTAIGQPKNKRI